VIGSTLEHARQAFTKRAWFDAYTGFSAADTQSPLSDPEDLERLATAAFLVGKDEASVAARTRAHALYLERSDPIRAAGAAYWLAFSIIDNPAQRAHAIGWLARARRLIEEAKQPCVEEGWILCSSGLLYVMERDVASARAAFARAAEIGARFQNPDLVALARHGHGRCLLALGSTSDGLALLDEVMIAVTNGEIGPLVSGVVYCSVISACYDLFDLRRAQEWTTALQAWCASQPDLVPFRGYCLIRRSELLQLHGEWQEAIDDARRACERAAMGARQPETGVAHYQLGELHRLRGEWTQAEEAFRLANQAGRKPFPGLALLRFSQGLTEAADASIRLALQEAREPRVRVPLLRAAVEIFLGTHDIARAREASEELGRIAKQIDSPYIRAVSSQAAGELQLADGDTTAALDSLRMAFVAWQELAVPYEMARVRAAMGVAYKQLGDQEGAHLEFETAQEQFEQLGARSEAARIEALLPSRQDTSNAGGLTGREVEVLRLIATGATNRAIATRLGISEKTVARHISNIFTKLDLPSRAAATAYAYEHKLV
jgi:DNA-binding CsgD family transcriptional regulator